MDVCPIPSRWHEIFQALEQAWRDAGAIGTLPPTPLILAGWAYSNDGEKKSRWETTLEWAREHSMTHVMPQLSPEDMYAVDELSSYEIGPLGGPMYRPWDFTSKTRPSEAEVGQALSVLTDRWCSIVGPTLASMTRPLSFTGKKKRRLLVFADPKITPPWGSWFALASGVQRRAFTQFRKAVNDAISPLHVDHIDFQTE